LARRPVIGFFETHPENYFLDRSDFFKLEAIRADYPLSLHGVGLSLGSAAGIDERHLTDLHRLEQSLKPFLVSDHLSWSTAGGAFLNDLLPLPYTREALGVVARNIDIVQERLQRRILIENPSAYARFAQSEMPETEFLRRLVDRTGCGLLLDVNNVFVSAWNLGFDAKAYIDALPAAAIEEIHLSGHHRNETGGVPVLVDDHGSAVTPAVWELYAHALTKCRDAPTLIEWDSNIPPLDTLLDEARKAEAIGRGLGRPAPSLSLHEMQERLARAIFAGDVQGEDLGLRGHFSINQNNVRLSLNAALEATYPTLVRLVGADFFTQLARQFIRVNPPKSPCLAAYGEELAEFIASLASCADHPYLADTARLEWQASRVCLHDVQAPLSGEALADAARAHGAENLTFTTQPGLAYLTSPFPVDKIWAYARACDVSAPPPQIKSGPVFLEIANADESVKIRELDAASFVFRQALQAGSNLGGAAAAAHTHDPLFNLAQALRLALRDGLFTCCHPQSHAQEARPCLSPHHSPTL
jgi:hypothetical protein